MSKNATDAKRIIIVEDDSDLRDSIIKYLRLKGYDVTGVGTALDFYAEVAADNYAVAILDLALPDQDGLVISQYIRSNTGMRILMLTARTSVEDRLAGYESGADVYLLKPVDFRELAASLENLFGRIDASHGTGGFPPKEHRADKCQWRLNREDWLLLSPENESVKLTSKEYIFLSALAKEPGCIVSRDELLSLLEYPATESANRSLESLVYRLRKKISPTLDTPIKTASGSGYIFSSPIALIGHLNTRAPGHVLPAPIRLHVSGGDH
jgi:DNA-binding response OmpR family regulator